MRAVYADELKRLGSYAREHRSTSADQTLSAANECARIDHIGANGVRIAGNDITAAGFGVMLDNPGSQVTIRGNRIWGTGQSQGIHIELAGQLGEVCHDMRITSNSITGFGDAGIQISTNNTA